MPTSKPRKSRKRTREIQARSRETGASHTKAMRANDAERDGGEQWPPAGVPESPHAYGGSFERYGIPTLLSADVPADASDAEIAQVAQVVADACDTLVRPGEGWYRAMADVWPIPVRQPSELPGHARVMMLLSPSARRPWWLENGDPNQDEVEEFVNDALTSIRVALHRWYPTTTVSSPELVPVGHDKAQDIVEKAGEDVRVTTTDPHPSVLENDGPVPEPDERPTYRFVDNLNRGWHIASSETPVRYAIDWAGLRRGRPDDLLTREELEAQHGPLRPVRPADPSDDSVLRGALTDAGVKAASSLLVALYRLTVEYSRDSAPGGYEGGSLVAGREGSWEAEALHRLAWTIGGDLDEKPKRYSEECVASVIEVLREWTQHPKRYVEVAENLAIEFSKVADEQGGWSKVADKPFQPGTKVGRHPIDTIEVVYHYLMSQSSRPVLDRYEFE
ncbi:hypothetical protein ACWGH2_42050 [Streptomyces sp. NPDC054871]